MIGAARRKRDVPTVSTNGRVRGQAGRLAGRCYVDALHTPGVPVVQEDVVGVDRATIGHRVRQVRRVGHERHVSSVRTDGRIEAGGIPRIAAGGHADTLDLPGVAIVHKDVRDAVVVARHQARCVRLKRHESPVAADRRIVAVVIRRGAVGSHTDQIQGIGRERLRPSLLRYLAHAMRARLQVGQGIVSFGISERGRLAACQLAIFVQIDVHRPPGQSLLGRIPDTVTVRVVPLVALDVTPDAPVAEVDVGGDLAGAHIDGDALRPVRISSEVAHAVRQRDRAHMASIAREHLDLRRIVGDEVDLPVDDRDAVIRAARIEGAKGRAVGGVKLLDRRASVAHLEQGVRACNPR